MTTFAPPAEQTGTTKRIGHHTVQLQRPPRIVSAYTVMGPKEGSGPLGAYFDDVIADHMWHEDKPERAERKFLEKATARALQQADLKAEDMDYFISGDLLNQIVTSTYTARSLSIPYMGIFAACATSTEGLGLGALLIDGGFARRVLVATASHYQSVERQYRYPIELNVQRKATNQWTATGGAAVVLAADEPDAPPADGQEGTEHHPHPNGRPGSMAPRGPRITRVTFGRVIDWGVADVNNMGAAMAPAAFDTLLRHFEDTNTTAEDYDLILTGDLARTGTRLFLTLLERAGVILLDKHMDGGASMYSPGQDAGAGASGAVTSAAALYGYALKEMAKGKYRRILALATGCLHSPVVWQQGETCPAICHAVVLESDA